MAKLREASNMRRKQVCGVPAEPAREKRGHPTRKKNKLEGCRDAGSVAAEGTLQRGKTSWWGAEVQTA